MLSALKILAVAALWFINSKIYVKKYVLWVLVKRHSD